MSRKEKITVIKIALVLVVLFAIDMAIIPTSPVLASWVLVILFGCVAAFVFKCSELKDKGQH